MKDGIWTEKQLNKQHGGKNSMKSGKYEESKRSKTGKKDEKLLQINQIRDKKWEKNPNTT